MEKKILFAVDDCAASKRAVKYAVKVCSAVKDMTYMLCNVQPLVPHIFTEMAEKEPEIKAEVDALLIENSEVKQCMCGSLKDYMVDHGISEQRISTISESVREGLVKDILTRAEQGNYDAIVLARGALTSSRDFFIGPTAATLAEHSFKIPVWIVGGEDTSMRFLLPVDGSRDSLKSVDHLTGMVGAHHDLKVTVFHVVPHLRHYYPLDFEKKSPRLQELLRKEDKKRIETFLETASDKFKDAGLKEHQVETKMEYKGYDISSTILQEAKVGRYSTVVIGRRGERDAFFTGRIAMRLLQKISEQTLWVIP